MLKSLVVSALAATALGDKKHHNKEDTHGLKTNWDYSEPNDYPPYNVKTIDLEDAPDTAVPGAGYVKCPTLLHPNKDLCFDVDAYKNYRIEGVEKWFKVKNSNLVEATKYHNSETAVKAIESTLSILKILPWLDKGRKPLTIAKHDVKFITRTFQAMKGQPPLRFNKGFCKFGGDGSTGMLGPCLYAMPGQKLNILVKNALHQGPFHIKNVVPTKTGYWMKMKNLYLSQNNIFIRDIMGMGSSTMTKSTLFPSKLAVGNSENVPGWSTNKSWDVFNLHLHGMEVVPHIFDPMGTSKPEADWISIQPNRKYGQQCYCYKFHLDEHHGMGTYLYHTHRHGTTSMTTWGGMFGVLLTDTDTIEGIRHLPAEYKEKSLMQNVVSLAKHYKIPFENDDLQPFVIWNTKWRFKGLFPNNERMASNPYLHQADKANIVNMGRVELNNYLPNAMPSTAMAPYLVNNEFRPTFMAQAGHLTWLKVVCVSTEWMCGIQFYYEESLDIVPFNVVAGDGITWEKPVYMAANAKLPTVVNGMSLFKVAEAYRIYGGGNREDLLIQFPHAGRVVAFQTSFGGQNSQLLGYLNVTYDDKMKCGKDLKHPCKEKDISEFELKGARPSRLNDKTSFYKNMTFAQELDRSKLPYVQWGISDREQHAATFQMFDVHRVNMILYGGKCSEWDICSRNPINHPYHIHVNPFQILDIYEAHFPGVISCIPAVQKILKGSVGEPLFRFQYGEWRDTAFVPPCGCLRLKQCFVAGAPKAKGGKAVIFEGKFVFHCHFLTHEDTGLIHNVMIRNSELPPLPNGEGAPAKFPGAIIPADCRACPLVDPCGVLPMSRGCSECPDMSWKNIGCSCIQPIAGIKYITIKDSLPNKLNLGKARKTSSVAVVALATLVGGCASLAAFAALMAAQRMSGRARYSAAVQVDAETVV
eukprot:CAMPEP_0195065762 /NCGR_PEP_ID=MMETSP0448-20130528/11314_1 /TAXON_ID=66468 /ORGANISM="Heterocapsa triquestra, Strain CCMP 448" /LENGTH=922 /DNA_ID=CAMNT_0040096907 /DNA_START=58 /DNA_END=2826 /DNA_ORIENTATION=-